MRAQCKRSIPRQALGRSLGRPALFLTIIWLLAITITAIPAKPLAYTPAPVNNPLKGLVPYTDNGNFPCSMEFRYFPLNVVVRGESEFDWTSLENFLQAVAAHGHQAIFRFYLDYPGQPTGVPKFLIDAGLKLTTVTNTNTHRVNISPDYEDPRLRTTLTNFIYALGTRFDGDPRIGFFEVGLLGSWGEWHVSPFDAQLWASPQAQDEVLDACQAAFKQTKILVREPKRAEMSQRPLGWHDDSFAYQTIAPPQWHFLGKLAQFGGLDHWKQFPIGGEIRPEVWGCVFDNPPSNQQGQGFEACVQSTHVSWLMDSGLYGTKPSQTRLARAETLVRHMGYEFYLAEVEIRQPAAGNPLSVKLSVRNLGVAPFYYDWLVELAAMDSQGKLVAVWPTHFKLSGLLPQEPDRLWAFSRAKLLLPPGNYTLLLHVANPLANGIPLRFANAAQDADKSGWLSLGTISVSQLR